MQRERGTAVVAAEYVTAFIRFHWYGLAGYSPAEPAPMKLAATAHAEDTEKSLLAGPTNLFVCDRIDREL